MIQGYLYIYLEHGPGTAPLGLLHLARDVQKAMKGNKIDGLVQRSVDELAGALADELQIGASSGTVQLKDGNISCDPKPRFFDDMEQRYIQGIALNGEKTVQGVLVHDDGR